jgi:hypothetical protein
MKEDKTGLEDQETGSPTPLESPIQAAHESTPVGKEAELPQIRRFVERFLRSMAESGSEGSIRSFREDLRAFLTESLECVIEELKAAKRRGDEGEISRLVTRVKDFQEEIRALERELADL